jgi:hypothetical protein
MSALRRLLRDERGDFQMIFLVGIMVLGALLFAIVASSQRFLQKETLQGSADAAALAASVVRAKAFNYIAFVNLVMSAVLAIFIFLKGVAMGLAIFLQIAAILCAHDEEDYCDYIPTATEVMAAYEAAAAKMEVELMRLAKAEQAIAQMTPALAAAEAYRAGLDPAFFPNYGRGLHATVVEPLDLPVEEASFGEFHEQAQPDLVRITPLGLLRLLPELEPGPDEPVAHAFAQAAAGVPLANQSVTVSALPLRLSSAWRGRRYARTRSWLDYSQADWRRSVTTIYADEQIRTRPAREHAEATAQAEVFSFGRHDDLWHVNWRARLSLSRPFVPLPDNLREFWVH